MASIFVDVADLYLRLNGYFTVKEFFQHPSPGVSPESDIDVLAIRLPYEKEVSRGGPPLPEDDKIVWNKSATLIAIVEAKGTAKPFNSSWLARPHVLRYTLKRVGFTSDDCEIERISNDLRREGAASSDRDLNIEFRLVLFSDVGGEIQLKNALVLKWQEVI